MQHICVKNWIEYMMKLDYVFFCWYCIHEIYTRKKPRLKLVKMRNNSDFFQFRQIRNHKTSCPLTKCFEKELTRKYIITEMCQMWEQYIQSPFNYRSHSICTANGERIWYENLISPTPSYCGRYDYNCVLLCIQKFSLVVDEQCPIHMTFTLGIFIDIEYSSVHHIHFISMYYRNS